MIVADLINKDIQGNPSQRAMDSLPNLSPLLQMGSTGSAKRSLWTFRSSPVQWSSAMMLPRPS